jgi:hypothetical protein
VKFPKNAIAASALIHAAENRCFHVCGLHDRSLPASFSHRCAQLNNRCGGHCLMAESGQLLLK